MVTERVSKVADAVGICPACGERNPARARYCMRCGSRMAAETGEHRTVTVLFADLSGFTAYSEMVDPEAVRAVAHAAASRFGEIVVRHGGVVDKVIGDCVMATFGTPEARADDPERAVRAALEMQEEIVANAARFASLHLSIGVMTGEALYAPVGPSGEYTVLGETVNSAARLQSVAGRGEILIGASTCIAVEGAIEVEEVPSAVGSGSTFPAWRVLGIAGSRRRRPRARLAGRDFELDRLSELWERATTEERAYLLTITGPAGIGKRRLINAFIERIGATAQVLVGTCLSYGEGMTYWPVTEVLRAAAAIAHDDPADAVSKKLGVMLEGLGVDDLDELRTMAVAMAHLVAAPTTPRGTFDATNLSRGELHWGIRRLLELLSMKRPVLLVIHDAHAAEPALLDLITSVAESGRAARIVVVASARPQIEARDTRLLAPGSRRRLMHLGPLDDDAARMMLEDLAGDAAPALGTVLDAAGGVPLFIEEALLLRRLEPDAPIPSDLAELIEGRLSRLRPASLGALARAAVMGEIFWEGSFEALVGAAAAGAALDDAIEHHLIRRAPTSSIIGEREYVFEHPLTLDVALGLLTQGERAAAHRAFAGWIRGLPDADEEYPELLSYHLVGASGSDDAIVHPAVAALAAAARRADAHEGTDEAQRFRRHALELLGDRDQPRALELSLAIARVAAARGEASVEAELERIADEAAALGRSDLVCGALLPLAAMARDVGEIARARLLLERAKAAAHAAGDAALMIEVLLESAALHLRSEKENDAAERDVRDALAQASASEHADLMIQAEALFGDIAYHRLDLAGAQEHQERAMALARRRGSVRWEAIAGSALATVRHYRGPVADAVRLAQRTLDLLERDPDPILRVHTLRLLGISALSEGDGAGAERWLRDAAALAEQQSGHLKVDVERYLTAALCWMGRTRAAARTAAGVRAAADLAHGPSAAAAALAEAYVATATGDESLARARFDEAVALIEVHGFALDIADAQLMLGRTLAVLGDPAGARAALERAHEIYARAGATARIHEVDATLRAG